LAAGLGPLVNPQVALVGGAFLGFEMTMNAGDTLVIDLRESSALLNGVADRLGALIDGSEFFSCPPGDSRLLFNAFSSSTGAAMDAAWRDAYA
jgi:hypothetical protein